MSELANNSITMPIREAATYLGISVNTLRRLQTARKIAHYRMGEEKKGVPVRFKRDDLDRWLEVHRKRIR